MAQPPIRIRAGLQQEYPDVYTPRPWPRWPSWRPSTATAWS